MGELVLLVTVGVDVFEGCDVVIVKLVGVVICCCVSVPSIVAIQYW